MDELNRVLIADDNATERLLIQRLVERWGYQSQICENGRDAFDAQELQSRLNVNQRTLRHQAQIEMREKQLHELISALPNPICFKDPSGRWLEANQACLEAFGVDSAQVIGRTDAEIATEALRGSSLLHEMTLCERTAWETRAPASREVIWDDGERQQIFEMNTRPLHAPDGQPRALIQIGHDITARKQMEDELRIEATIDPLTGALTRREFMKSFENAIGLARRHGYPIAFCICDIDNFKTVNDTHGHALGDAVLKRFVDVLRSVLRDTDIAGRFGGDEFCAVLPYSAEEGAMTAFERVREQFHAVTFTDAEGESFHVSGSFGISVYHAEREGAEVLNPKRMMELADEALYRVKEKGRNGVSC